MHRNRWILALGCMLGIAACGEVGDAEQVARATVNTSPLIATLTTDHPVYAPGDPVGLTLTLRNAGPGSVTLEYSSAQRYDFVIEDARAPVWRWSAAQMFAQMMGEETLNVGDSVVYRERFRGQLPAGSYRAIGTVVRLGEGEAIAAAAEFQVR